VVIAREKYIVWNKESLLASSTHVFLSDLALFPLNGIQTVVIIDIVLSNIQT
jgi:hypothetical protein